MISKTLAKGVVCVGAGVSLLGLGMAGYHTYLKVFGERPAIERTVELSREMEVLKGDLTDCLVEAKGGQVSEECVDKVVQYTKTQEEYQAIMDSDGYNQELAEFNAHDDAEDWYVGGFMGGLALIFSTMWAYGQKVDKERAAKEEAE